ncbi:MAG: pyridoxamine 5'-phosphate oxidase family protein [Oscillospiraceae bacterium]|nr:pyridoxamine 5'-phosphate oxidase family protein [Oscillospiraceae bacterium]
MKEVTEFLTSAGCFFLGTENGDQPEIRPIGVIKEYDGKLYTAVGKHKNVYKQIVANPTVCLVDIKDRSDWVRVRATAVDAPQEIVDRVFEENPFLRNLYNEENGHELGVLELTDGEVEFCSMMGPDRTEKL